MKITPEEEKRLDNFKPGAISKDGFLGTDERHVHDIIEEDARTMAGLNISAGTIAERMQFFIVEGNKGLQSAVDLGEFTVRVNWFRGMLPCPFGEPKLHHKVTAKVYNKALDEDVEFTQLNVHLIGSHGFFMGKGSSFRLEPDALIRILKIKQIN